MINILKCIRYLVFLIFIISNAIVTSVAVWNLSIMEANATVSTMKQIDTYLIVLGSSGLLLIFSIIFFEIYGKIVFLCRAWFEILWVGLFGIMNLVGAAFITSQDPAPTVVTQDTFPVPTTVVQDSPSTSNKVLEAFTWILAFLLLGYMTLLSILCFVKRKEDPSIWRCGVAHFPWMNSVQTLKSNPTTPTKPASVFRSKTPVIFAPKPQRIAPILNYRAGLDSEYEIEHFRPDSSETDLERPMPPVPASTNDYYPSRRPVPQQPEQMQQPVFSTPFYHSAVQRALESQPGSQAPPPPPPAQLGEIRRLPPSPPPLGDWPRLDATTRARHQRKPLPNPHRQPPLNPPHPAPLSQLPPTPSASQPLPSETASVPRMTLASTAPLQPRRTRPGGPRIRSGSHDISNPRRPPPLDLSQLSSYRSRADR